LLRNTPLLVFPVDQQILQEEEIFRVCLTIHLCFCTQTESSIVYPWIVFSSYVDNATPQSQPQWADASGVDECGVNSDMLNNQHLTIDEGTISVSSQYS
jgi:hypothetical protein